MPTVRFQGVAPVRRGAAVRMLVDDARHPTRADWIEDVDGGVEYRIDDPSKPRAEALPGLGTYVRATVDSAAVYSSGVTDLTVSDVRPE